MVIAHCRIWDWVAVSVSYCKFYINSLDWVKNVENGILGYPQKEQYVRFINNEWGKTMPSYIKIV